MSKRSALFLFAILALPVLLFLFLRIFGENRYQEIPILQAGEVQADCPPRFSEFTLTDQLGRSITNHVLDKKISVINFFFLGCPEVCQEAMEEQARVYYHFLDHPLIQFLSFSLGQSDAVQDVLRYSKSHRADPTQWVYLSGDQQTILSWAKCRLFLDTGASGFSQGKSGFVVLDGRQRIRGYYDPGDSEDMDRLIAELQILALDYNQ